MFTLRRVQRIFTFVLFSFLISIPHQSFSQGFHSFTSINNLPVTAISGEKPQSKVWSYAGKWWMVMPNSSGTQVWRLDGNSWTSILNISANTATYADCKADGNVTHILLYHGITSSLVSVEYVPASGVYQLWTGRTSTVSLTLDSGVETASIDIDSNGRMWIASAGTTTVNVRWSDSPYSSWSSPIEIASGINDDDICAVIAFNGKIGVLWSNQNTRRFGFKYHEDGNDPGIWSSDEVPASQSALNVGAGMADDHLNIKAASDGTLYAAVKTSYDVSGYTKIAMLVRRPSGSWDNLYNVDESGTRGQLFLNEAAKKVYIVYSASEGNNPIVYKSSSTTNISFGSRTTLISSSCNDISGSKQNIINNIVLMASNGSTAYSILANDNNLVAHWAMEESAGAVSLTDSSVYGNNAAVTGSLAQVYGQRGYGSYFDGQNDYVICPNSSILSPANTITLAAWIKPVLNGTQDIINKRTSGSVNGYELTLSANTAAVSQKVFVRFNQQSSGDTYRVNSTTTYPTDGSWIHAAATYDGTIIKLYINGVLESSLPAAITIVNNNLPVTIGAQSDGTRKFTGTIDDARIYNTALSESEIQALLTTWTPPIPAPIPPELISPVNLAAGVNLSPSLSWNISAGAENYQVQVSTSSDFSAIVFNQTGITGTSVTVTPALLNNTVYYWRVNASNPQGTSAWSSVWSFTTLPAIELETNGAGYALDFDGLSGSTTSDHVNCGNAASLNITQSLTIEAWIKPSATKTHSIVKKLGTGSGFELFLSNATPGLISLRLNGSTSSYRVNSTSSYNQPLNTWIHVAGTYDFSTKSMKIYVNGKEENSFAGPSSIASNTNSLSIGAELTDFSKSFQGSIDEVRVWNIVRTEADIKANMTKKLSGTENGLVGYWRMDETAGILVNDQTLNNNHGTMVNMDPATDHIWSGAALGDTSAYDYDAAGGYSATLNHTNGDFMSATTTSGTINGIQIYRADNNSVRNGSTFPAGYTLDANRFWGVKVVGSSAPAYTLVYNYSGNPAVISETGLKLVKRNAVSDPAWIDAAAVLDINSKTLTVTGATGTEYSLAVPIVILPADPSALSVTSVSSSVLQLNWTDNSDNETGFEIERSSAGPSGPFTLIQTVTSGVNTFTDEELLPQTEYCYRVRALNSAGYSGYSNISCGATMAPVNNLVGHWALEENSGASVISDSSTYNNNGSVTGNLTQVTGQRGYAQSFNGSSHVVIPHNSSLDITNTITLAAWIKPGASTTQDILNKKVNGTTDGYEITLSSSTAAVVQKVFVRFNQKTSGDTYRVNSVTTYPVNGNWIHAAATYDGTTIKLYINGILESSMPAAITIANNALPVILGGQSDGTRRFTGSIDDARIYNTALNESEIQALLAAWTPPVVTPLPPVLVSPPDLATGITTTPTLSWNASSGAEAYQVQVSTASDFSTIIFSQSGITGTSVTVNPSLLNNTVYYWRVNASNVQGTSTWSSGWSFTTIAPVFVVEDNGAGYALDFDGINDYINCGNNPSVQITGKSITMEAWIKPTKIGTMSILKKTGVIGGGTGYELYCGSAGFVYCRFNGLDASRAWSTTPYPSNGTWIHVAATYDGVSTKIYINGVLEDTTAYTANIVNSSNILEIANDPSTAARFFQGSMDEVRLWNISRTEEEIKSFMTRKLSGSEQGLAGYWRMDETAGILIKDESIYSNHGTMVNMDPADRIWSSAALGNASAFDYSAEEGYTADLIHQDGDSVTANSTSGTAAGIQLYRADANSIRTGSTFPEGYTLDSNRFWGVRTIGTASPVYTFVYNYSGNPLVTNEAGLKLVKRNAVSDNAWIDAYAVLDITEHSLTVSGAGSSEYALAFSIPQDPVISLSSESLLPFSTEPGIPSAEQSYSVWAGNLNDGLTITAPDNFEISLSSVTGFSSTLFLPHSGGTISPTPIFVRFNPSGTGTFSGKITHISSGAVQVDVDVNGTSAIEPQAVRTFQEGFNGYSGTSDTHLWQNEPSSAHGNMDYFKWDTESSGGIMYSLLRFQNIFGSNAGQIPPGAQIQSATLTYNVFDTGDFANVYEVNIEWNEDATYNNFGGDEGVQPDEYGYFLASAQGNPAGVYNIDVKASLVRWMSDTSANKGWLFSPSGTDGVQVRSSEYSVVTQRPKLTVVYLVNPPNQPVLIEPSDFSVNVSTSPSLSVLVSDPQNKDLTVSYYGRPKNISAVPFSIIVLPDAQYYTGSINGGLPSMFSAQTQWCVNNKETWNIQYVSMLGDITENNTLQEWEYANSSMSQLDAFTPGIPYGIALGNHDYLNPPSLYSNYFPSSRFAGRPYYGGSLDLNNENHYEFFSSGGLDFVVINLSSGSGNPTALQLDWADSLLKSYPGKRGILVNHSVLNTGNPASFTTPGQTIYNALKDNPNLFLMLGGHVPGEGRRADTFDGNTIYTLLSDYQSQPNGGNGYMRIMQFEPSENRINVKTYSPVLDNWMTSSSSQFNLDFNMDINPFQLIGTQNNIPSGTTVSEIWQGLSTTTEYEWYVTISNGENTITGPVWSFTTEAPSIIINTKISLEGPCNGSGEMSTALNNNNLIPLSSENAYSASEYGYIPVSVTSIPTADIVDWVLIELRSGINSGTKIVSRAAFLKSDGTIVDLDGLSPVIIPELTEGNYYIMVHHRNHAAVISAQAVSLNANSTLYDFTTSSGAAYGSNLKLAHGRWCLYSGDVNHDGFVDVQDLNIIYLENVNGLTGYNSTDLNLDTYTEIEDLNIVFFNSTGDVTIKRKDSF